MKIEPVPQGTPHFAPMTLAAAPIAKLRAAVGPLPVMPALLVVAALLPQEFGVTIGGLELFLPRLLLLVLMPVLAARAAGIVSRPGFRASISDIAILPAALWMFLAVTMSEGIARATVGSSALILEFAGAYLTGRTVSRQPGSMLALARFTAWAIALFAALGPFDILTGRHITHDIAGVALHNSLDWVLDYRSGMLRAQGAQEHPILLGMVCCCGMVLSLVALRGFKRALTIACCFAGLVSTLSSAPLMAAIMGMGLLAYRRVTPGFDARWRLMGIFLGTLAAILFSFHPAPFGFLISHFTLDPSTGYFRILIWQVAGTLVLNNPLFGIGLDNWQRASWMPNTVDAVWLRSAMMFGIVGSLLIATVVIGSCSRRIDTARKRGLSAAERNVGVGLSIIMFLFVYTGFTVHFWGCTWIMLGLFAGMRARLGEAA